MSLALITQPTFLRRHFWFTRKGLLGRWPWQIAGKKLTVAQIEALPEIEEVAVVHPSEKSVAQSSWPPLSEVSTAFQQEQMVFQAPAQTITPAVTLVEGGIVYQPVVRQPIVRHPAVTTLAQPKITSKTSWWKPAAKFVLTVVIVASLSLGALIIVPEMYDSIFSNSSAVNEVANAAKQSAQTQPARSAEPEPYKPPQNPDLPTGTWVSIPRIGVYAEVRATEDPNQALDTGVWLVPDFGRPGDYSQPTILAAHRYGWDWWWKSDYWKYNSFYLLTDTQAGDTVEIIYDQRKWVYQIYAVQEGELITDYDADLILYTCKFLKSPIRYFRYAKLVIP